MSAPETALDTSWTFFTSGQSTRLERFAGTGASAVSSGRP